MKRFSGTGDLTRGPIFTKVIALAVPIMLTSILLLLFNAADLVIIGQYCGGDAVAAVGATLSLSNLITNMFIGLSIGASVAVAQAYGANDNGAQYRTVHTAIATALIGGVVLTVIGIAFSDTFLEMMGTPEDILQKSALYMKITFGGAIFKLVYVFSAAILRSVGDTRSPIVFLTVSGIVNVVLNIFFVTRLDMEVAGVALATTISQVISAMLVVIALMRRSDACRLYIKELKIHKEELKKMMSVGIPAGIQGSVFSISNVLIQSSINSFDKIFVIGNSAAINIEDFVYVILNSFCQAAVSFVGQNYGAGNIKRLKKSVFASLGGVMLIGMPAGVLAYLFGEQLLSIYITDSPEAIAYGVERMLYLCVPYFIFGFADVFTGSLQGLNSSFTAMSITILGVVGVRIGWIYTVFASHHTPGTLYISYPLSWTFTFVCQMIAFFIICKKREKNMTSLN